MYDQFKHAYTVSEYYEACGGDLDFDLPAFDHKIASSVILVTGIFM